MEIPATQSMTHRDASISIGRKELLFRGLTSEWGLSLFIPKNLSAARFSLSLEEGTGKPTTNAPVYLTFNDGPGANTFRLSGLLHEQGRAWRNFEDSMPRFLDELVSLPFHFHAM